MFTITEQVAVQIANILVNFAMLVAILKAVRSITRLEFKVEMMWKAFSKNIGISSDTEDK